MIFRTLYLSRNISKISFSIRLLINQYLYKNPSAAVTSYPKLRKFHTSTPDSCMAPIGKDSKVDPLLKDNKVVIFSKVTCPFCHRAKKLFDELNVSFTSVEVDQRPDGAEIHEELKAKTGKQTVPQIFIDGKHIGGSDDLIAKHGNGELNELLRTHSHQYDLIVIGGGSGGLAASKKAASLGKKVLVLDFVKPTPIGTKWGLGGTCVNVGCIPKKLIHQSALLGQFITDSYNYGWETSDGKPPENHKTMRHNWSRMIEQIQNYIKSLNWGYKTELRDQKVTYQNAYATFEDEHKVKLVDKSNKENFVTGDKIIIATGERPRYPDIPGAKEYGITSDDLFSLPYPPGKTLVVGASYVALECAGFLKGLGYDVTLMVRSIFLRGFDQEIAEMIGNHMKGDGIKIIRPGIPSKVEKVSDPTDGQPGTFKIFFRKGQFRMDDGSNIDSDSKEEVEEFNTILFAIGRDACTKNIGLDKAGVKFNKKTGKIPVKSEQTNVENIYAIGDVLQDRLELTPVAIEAGKLLASRLFSNSQTQCDYINVPTTVFTPIEYGAVGYSEDKAVEEFGEHNIEVYISFFNPLEWKLPHRSPDICYAKLICLRDNEKVIGFHYLGPNAGEVTQLAGLVLKKNSIKADFDALIGIHPTCAEIFSTLTVTKRSGDSAKPKGC